MNDITPLMKQYQEIKVQHPEAILFFRVGDFYEMFYNDAVKASHLLDITLTSRDKSKEGAVPLCGIPYHAASGYIARLIKAGQTVAICEQMESPKKARQQYGGPLRREVVKVITPGTLIEPELLTSKENNFLAAISGSPGRFGLAFMDLSTGEFQAAQFEDDDEEHSISRILQELSRLEPKELLLTQSMAQRLEPLIKTQSVQPRICVQKDQAFAPVLAQQVLQDHFGVRSLDGYGCRDLPLAVAAAGSIVLYLKETQRRSLAHLTRLSTYSSEDQLVLDAQTQRNLEITRCLSHGRTDGSVLGVLDRTLTPMGGRLLRQWLLKPLLNIQMIHQRLDTIQESVEELEFRSRLRTNLKGILDLERLVSRIPLGAAHARDLVALKQSLSHLPEIHKLLTNRSSTIFREIATYRDDLEDVRERIAQTLVDDPPINMKDGGFIRDGFDSSVDELRGVQRDSGRLLMELENQERQRTGIESLKVRYTHVFGYFIEVSRANLSRVPADYQRKQTLTQSERFMTPELKALEDRILGAGERLKAHENQLFEELRQVIAQETTRIQAVASTVAQLDVLTTLAEVASVLQYNRPVVHDGFALKILDGRHPVLETHGKDRFIPNDTYMDNQDHCLAIITGPNMAGKSTYMRQVALIVILAQMGSFVPAREAEIGVVDRIFTRVGASDNLIEGQSTFMLEMSETANLLNNATPRSLVLLDEIGRGTSTFDGLSIAWAVTEYLHDHLKSRTLFATHYHQLTELALTRPGVKNYNMAVREWNEEIIFLRKVLEGGTDRSYGIQVARLAGVPREILDRAKEILSNLEGGELNDIGQPRIASHSSGGPGQLDLFLSDKHPVVQELRKMDIHQLTPLEALNRLDDLKKKAENPPSGEDTATSS